MCIRDSAQNAAKHINENYARELLELHTLGVDGGYTQHDVQELARVLTGFGESHKDPALGDPPKINREYAGQYIRLGLFEFNPNRHDYGDKLVLGHTIHGRGAITTKGFERDAQRMGKLMSEKFDIGFIDVGGWDTHVGQGAAKGYLATRLTELGKGLAAFATAMGPAWASTTVVVMSEFGRTLRQNGNRGTDHGHGTAYIVMGGAIRGGRVAGEQRDITEAGLFQNRDLPVLNEYRGVLGALFARQYGLSAPAIDRIFPGARPQELQLA